MITTLKIKLENCYGIKKLEEDFDFSKKNVISIYAPNGTMKTSFSKTFNDIIKNKKSSDIIFKERVNKREIIDQNDLAILPESVFVIEPYIPNYQSEKETTLLVNKELKDQYQEILKAIEQNKSNLFTKLKQLSGLPNKTNTVEDELIKIFGKKQVLDILIDLENQILETSEHPFSSIIYYKIYEEKNLTFLNTKDFKKQLTSYIERYDTLIKSSKYLQKGFNHYNVSDVQKSLKSNGFFKAKHSVNLYNELDKKAEIVNDENELQEIITKELNSVLDDEQIKTSFNEIETKLSTAQLREFREYLNENRTILPELSNLEKFRKNIWISYLVEQKELYKNLIEEYKTGKTQIEKIIAQAKDEETEWKDVINIFNRRFSVPFILEAKNQEDVILKSANLNAKFSFIDKSNPPKEVEEKDLLEVLSQGERRALYLLNIIFEVRARQKANQETIFIIDDIADSFDYKNKYAIIEYLKEIAETPHFYQIILTHNFDFYRTIQSRILTETFQRDNSYIAQIFNDEIKLSKAGSKNITNPFSNWKTKLNDPTVLVATIPFIRNLIEFREGNKSDSYKKLTSLLHIKEDTSTIKISDLIEIYSSTIKTPDLTSYPTDKKIIDIIFEVAENVYSEPNDESLNLENKIALSIGIRLKAETLMWSKVSDKTPINGTQTGILFGKYKIEHGDTDNEKDNIKLCELVNLMTPENIHLNSFMYEPILDMATEHLKELYKNTRDTVA